MCCMVVFPCDCSCLLSFQLLIRTELVSLGIVYMVFFFLLSDVLVTQTLFSSFLHLFLFSFSFSILCIIMYKLFFFCIISLIKIFLVQFYLVYDDIPAFF